MKKQILSMALAAMVLAPGAAFAKKPQANCNNCVPDSCAVNNCQPANCNNAPCAQQNCQPGCWGMYQQDYTTVLPGQYAGLTLTDNQKSQLQQVDAKHRAARKQQASASKSAKKEQKMQAATARKADRKQYLEEVEAILGPDQYVAFLENWYVNGGSQKQKAAKTAGKAKKMQKGAKAQRVQFQAQND